MNLSLHWLTRELVPTLSLGFDKSVPMSLKSKNVSVQNFDNSGYTDEQGTKLPPIVDEIIEKSIGEEMTKLLILQQ